MGQDQTTTEWYLELLSMHLWRGEPAGLPTTAVMDIRGVVPDAIGGWSCGDGCRGSRAEQPTENSTRTSKHGGGAEGIDRELGRIWCVGASRVRRGFAD
jgi:hypothetical protein